MVNKGYSFSRKDPISLEISVTRHIGNGKTRPARPPDVATNPDRSCTYLVRRAHRMGKTSGCHRPWLPRGRRTSPSLDQHPKEHWPGGKNKDDPRARENPREGYRLLGKSKTKAGPCWRSFIQSEMSRGSHNTQPR